MLTDQVGGGAVGASATGNVVLHLFHTLEPGGAELRTLALIEQLRGRDVSFVVGVLGHRVGSLEGRFLDAGCTIVRIPLNSLFPLRLARTIRQQRVTTLHAHSATASGFFLLVAFLMGVPTRIAHFRSDDDGRTATLRRGVQRGILRTLIRVTATRVVAVSPGALEFAGVAGRSARATVVPNGVIAGPLCDVRMDLHQLMNFRSRFLVLHVGRDKKSKNRGRALKIFARAVHDGLDGAFLIAGRVREGEAADLRALAESLGVSERVAILGQRDDLAQIMSSTDSLLVTSSREGLPGVVLESLSVGTPVLASDLPGTRWIASHLPGVVTLPLTSEDDAWAKALQHVTQNVSKEQRLLARERFERSAFSMQRAVRSYEELWGLR